MRPILVSKPDLGYFILLSEQTSFNIHIFNRSLYKRFRSDKIRAEIIDPVIEYTSNIFKYLLKKESELEQRRLINYIINLFNKREEYYSHCQWGSLNKNSALFPEFFTSDNIVISVFEISLKKS